MTSLASDSLIFAALAGLAAYLMTAAGLQFRALMHRVTYCPVCHHPRTRCTCRWL